MRDRRDLLLGDADGAARLAVLREHELARAREPDARLAELAQLRIEQPRRAPVQREALHRVVEDVGHEREHRPPVAGRPGRGARLGHRIAIAEQQVVQRQHRRRRLGSRNLTSDAAPERSLG